MGKSYSIKKEGAGRGSRPPTQADILQAVLELYGEDVKDKVRTAMCRIHVEKNSDFTTVSTTQQRAARQKAAAAAAAQRAPAEDDLVFVPKKKKKPTQD